MLFTTYCDTKCDIIGQLWTKDGVILAIRNIMIINGLSRLS